MDVEYVCATPELRDRLKERSGSNASDFVRFDEHAYSLIALVDGEPAALIVAKKRPLASPPADCEAVEITSPASLTVTVLVTVWPVRVMRPKMMPMGMIQTSRKKVVSLSSFSG